MSCQENLIFFFEKESNQMLKLSHSIVLRAGVTAPNWSHGTSKIRVSSNDYLDIDFSIASKGGGTTMVRTRLSPKDFGPLIEQMMICDPDQALKAMSAAIAEHHAEKAIQ